MVKPTKIFLCVVLASALTSCASEINDYSTIDNPFDIKDYFNGPVIAWGMLQNYQQQVTRRFCVEIMGKWQDKQGTLDETFYFDDGEVSYRTWQLQQQEKGHYLGKAQDVSGTATAINKGFAFNMKYNLIITLDGDDYEVAMDDWMYQLDQYRVMNKTSLSKFGVNVAEVTLFFDKEQPEKKCALPTARPKS